MPSRRDFIENKNPKQPRASRGSRKSIDRNPSRKSLHRSNSASRRETSQGRKSGSYLDKYNSRNSVDKNKNSSARRKSYDSNVSFKRNGSHKKIPSHRRIGSRDNKSAQAKKLNPVRPPSRKKVERPGSRYNSRGGGSEARYSSRGKKDVYGSYHKPRGNSRGKQVKRHPPTKY